MKRTIQSLIGTFYHSPGDDPMTVEGEAEPPTVVLPLWALDQFAVHEPGQEPALSSDLTGVGYKRTDGAQQYIAAMEDMVNNLSTEKVYTFCFWGVAQFFDVINWEITGVTPWKVDFNTFATTPPICPVIYEMPDEESSKETRHLISRKQYLFKVALWSDRKPPPQEELEKMVSKEALDDQKAQSTRGTFGGSGFGGKHNMNVFACCTARDRDNQDKLLGA